MRKLIDFVRRFIRMYTEHKLTISAAAMSYNLTMTFFPLLIVLYTLLGNSYTAALSLLDFVDNLMSAETVTIIRDFIYYVATHRSTAMFVAGLTVLLTSSSAAVRVIASTINSMQGSARFTGIWALIYSVVFSVVLLLGVYLSFFIILAGPGILEKINEILPIIDLSGVWIHIRLFVLYGILLLLFWSIYVGMRPRKDHYRTWPGALLAALAMSALSYIFSNVISASVRYPLVYGYLASMILLMLWLYFCSLIVFAGAAFNIILRNFSREKQAKEASSRSEPPAPADLPDSRA